MCDAQGTKVTSYPDLGMEAAAHPFKPTAEGVDGRVERNLSRVSIGTCCGAAMSC
jgi:hypothetical protein